MLPGPNPEIAASFTIPLLGLRPSLASYIALPAMVTKLWLWLGDGRDDVGLLAPTPVLCMVRATEVLEVLVGPCSLQPMMHQCAVLPGPLDLLAGLLQPGLPDADLVLTLFIADNVHAYAPIVVLEGSLEYDIVYAVVSGENQREPEGEGVVGKVRGVIVSGGHEGHGVYRAALAHCPFGMGVRTLDKAEVLGLQDFPVGAWDVESLDLPPVGFKAGGAYVPIFGEGTPPVAVVAAAAAGAPGVAKGSWGHVLLVPLNCFELVLTLLHPNFAVVGA